MNCGWMERVAFALDGEWTPEVERHLAGCSECRALLADRELLRATPEIAAEAYTAVRERVMAAVRPSYAMWWRAAAAVGLVMAGVAWWSVRLPEAERLEIAVRAPGVVAIPNSAAQAARTLKPAPRMARTDGVALAMRLREELEAQPPRIPGEVGVAMQTEDPEVFILLVGGEDDE